MIFSVDVKFEALNHEAAEHIREEIERSLDLRVLGTVIVSTLAEVAPMVHFEDEE